MQDEKAVNRDPAKYQCVFYCNQDSSLQAADFTKVCAEKAVKEIASSIVMLPVTILIQAHWSMHLAAARVALCTIFKVCNELRTDFRGKIHGSQGLLSREGCWGWIWGVALYIFLIFRMFINETFILWVKILTVLFIYFRTM